MVTNGRIPVGQMVVRQGLYLWPSTAAKFDLMDAWLVSLGYPHMIITQPYGAYRSIADQIIVKAQYGAGAATPGYSNHGLGAAWDIYNIEHYPTAIIDQACVKFQLRKDAGNGAGGIESWHMHDYNGVVPADSGITPIDPNPIAIPKEADMYGATVIQIDNGPAGGGTQGAWYVISPTIIQNIDASLGAFLASRINTDTYAAQAASAGVPMKITQQGASYIAAGFGAPSGTMESLYATANKIWRP